MPSSTRSHSRGIVCFTDALELLRNAHRAARSVPATCRNGHPFTPENLQTGYGEYAPGCVQGPTAE